MGTRHKAGAQQGSGKRFWLLGMSITGCPYSRLVLGLVGVRDAFGHDGRGRGDQQRQDDQELLHFKSPCECCWPSGFRMFQPACQGMSD
jgi:hypothetical protein